jgi:hypothetical protein
MLVILAGILGLGYLGQSRYDAKVPLGTWYGTFTAPTGSRGAVLVVVKRKQLGANITYMGSSNGVYFRGSAQLCLTAQVRQYFRLSGFTDQSGPGFAFYFLPIRGPVAGLRFSDDLHGARHQDKLAMSGHLAPFAPPGDVLPSVDPLRQTPFTLVKDEHHR